MNFKTIFAVLALAVAAWTLPALAEEKDPQTRVDEWFAKYDKDSDGRLTVTEFRMGKTFFNSLDIDGDGILTREETLKALTGAAEATELSPWSMDADGDGYVTRREWTGDQAGFDKHDHDNDGVISKIDGEIAADRTRARGRLASFDKDKDGKLSRDEWPGDDASFRGHDTDRDGWLTESELGDRNRRK